MVEQVHHDFHAVRSVGHERGREAACIYIKRRMPGMIDPRCAGEPVFANDLRKEMQAGAGFAPTFEGDVGPDGCHFFHKITRGLASVAAISRRYQSRYKLARNRLAFRGFLQAWSQARCRAARCCVLPESFHRQGGSRNGWLLRARHTRVTRTNPGGQFPVVT